MMRLLVFTVLALISFTAQSQIWLDNSCPIENQISSEDYTSVKANNLLTLVVDQEGKLMMNGKRQDEMSEIRFKEAVYDFLTNPSKENIKADSPKQAIIALGSYGKHDYYDLILRYVREVYLYAWDSAAEEKYNSIYMELNCKKRSKIRTGDFPYNVIELNNQKPNDKKKPSFSPGVPVFDGDVSDN
jgi:hypothetical protein